MRAAPVGICLRLWGALGRRLTHPTELKTLPAARARAILCCLASSMLPLILQLIQQYGRRSPWCSTQHAAHSAAHHCEMASCSLTQRSCGLQLLCPLNTVAEPSTAACVAKSYSRACLCKHDLGLQPHRCPLRGFQATICHSCHGVLQPGLIAQVVQQGHLLQGTGERNCCK